MRKLKISNYIVKIRVPDKMNPGQIIEGEYPYLAKDTILNLLFNPDLKLSGAEVVKQNILAVKIESCTDDEIMLEDEEYLRIKKAFDVFRGFNRNDTEMVKRIEEAEVVEVEEKGTQEGKE